MELNTESRSFGSGLLYSYNFISFPLIAESRLGKKRRFLFDYGIHNAIKVSGSVTDVTTGRPIGFSNRCPQCDNGRWDVGVILGLGYQYPITDRFTAFGILRLNLSLTEYEMDRGYHHYAYAPIIGISYGLGK